MVVRRCERAAITGPAGWRESSQMWKPWPPAGAPSAWMLTTAATPGALAIRARSSMHGPTPVSLCRVRMTRMPWERRIARTRRVTSQVKACSG